MSFAEQNPTLSGETGIEGTAGLAIEVEDIVDFESFGSWLNHQPDELAQVLVMRMALRTLPNVFSIFSVDESELTTDVAQKLVLHSFRANFMSWVALIYPAHNVKAFAGSAASTTFSYLSAHSINHLALTSAHSAVYSALSIDNSVLLAFSSLPARAAFSNPVAPTVVWENFRLDASACLENDLSAVASSPLWLGANDLFFNPSLQNTTQIQITTFQKTEDYTALPWGLWIAWWENLQDDTSKSLFGEKADLEIAKKDDAFWDRDVDVVVGELAEIVGWPWGQSKTASPFTYGWSSSGKVTLTGDAFSAIWVPQNRSPDDAANRLAAAKKAAENLVADLKSGMLQASPAYATGLNRYVDELPGDVTSSIYVADQELRTLRDDLEDDLKSGFATDRFARRLLRVIEAHYGLRPYYPDLLNFYDDVRDGRLTEPPPLEAISKLEQLIQEHTPDVFDDSVSESLQRLEPDKEERPPQSDDAQKEAKGAADEQPIALPKDPIADIDPARAEQNAKSAALEKIDGVLSKAEKGAKNIERAEKVGKTFHKVGKPLWDFVKEWYESGGDVPPVG